MGAPFVPSRPGALSLLGSWLPGFAPGRRLKASEWIEANICLAEKNNAQPGPLKLFKYQRDMIDMIMRPGVRVAVTQLASQIGKSLTIDSILMYLVANEPGQMLHISPDEKMAKDFVRSRINPMVSESINLRGIFGTGGQGGAGNSLETKEFAGGTLHCGSSHKAGDLAARSVKTVFLDEVDRFRINVGNEGDAVDLARKRTHNYDDSLVIVASTPTNYTSRIAPWFRRGNQCRWFVPCPNCGVFDYLRPEQLTFKPGKFETARLICLHCAHPITERERRAALQLGEWRPTAEGEAGIISFHAPVFISEAPKATLSYVAQEQEASHISPEKRKSYLNTWMAEVYEEDAFKLEPETLQAYAIPLQSPYPDAIVYFTAGVDVQHNRLECMIVGHGPAHTVYIIEHVVMMGDTTSDTPWIALDKLLDSTFAMSDGRVLPVDATALDTGAQTSMCYSRSAMLNRTSRRVHPVKGVGGIKNRMNIKSSSTTPQGQSLLAVGVDMLKERIIRSVAMTTDAPYRIYMSNALDSEVFEGIASEQLVTRYVRDVPVREFKPIRRRNEVLDCCVYALAIAEAVPHSLREGNRGNVYSFPRYDKILNHRG